MTTYLLDLGLASMIYTKDMAHIEMRQIHAMLFKCSTRDMFLKVLYTFYFMTLDSI